MRQPWLQEGLGASQFLETAVALGALFPLAAHGRDFDNNAKSATCNVEAVRQGNNASCRGVSNQFKVAHCPSFNRWVTSIFASPFFFRSISASA